MYNLYRIYIYIYIYKWQICTDLFRSAPMLARARLAAWLAAPAIGTSYALAQAKAQSWPSMATPSKDVLPPVRRPSGETDAILNYQKSHVTAVASRRDLEGSDGALEGADWDQHHVLIRDGRRADKPPTLHGAGFELVADVKEQHCDYYDEEAQPTIGGGGFSHRLAALENRVGNVEKLAVEASCESRETVAFSRQCFLGPAQDPMIGALFAARTAYDHLDPDTRGSPQPHRLAAAIAEICDDEEIAEVIAKCFANSSR